MKPLGYRRPLPAKTENTLEYRPRSALQRTFVLFLRLRLQLWCRCFRRIITRLAARVPFLSTRQTGPSTWLQFQGYPQGLHSTCRTKLLDYHPTAYLASSTGCYTLRADSNQRPRPCECWTSAFSMRCAELSHFNLMPNTSLLLLDSWN